MPAFTWTTQQIPDLTGRRAIVTGANSGIGFHTALELARHGAEVVLACRNAAKGKEALRRIQMEVPNCQAKVEILDTASLASINSFATRQITAGQPIHLLINNAGVMAGDARETTPDGFELQFGTNHLGHFALTGQLLPLLRLAEAAEAKATGRPHGLSNDHPPRIVTVASVAHKRGTIAFDDLQAERSYDTMVSYNQSKLANLLFTFELERRLRLSNSEIVAVAAHPGVARTNIFKPGASKALRARAINLILGLFGPLFNSDIDGALPTLFAATAPMGNGQAVRPSSGTVEPAGYYGPQGTIEIRGGNVGPAQIAPAAHNAAAAKQLWTVSEALTGVSYLDQGV